MKEIIPEQNPFPELVSDEIYEILKKEHFLDGIKVRNYLIRKQFKSLRSQKVKAGDAIEIVLQRYPYLEFDSIRKICYGTE